MKKVRKGKKILLAALIAVLVIVAIVIIVLVVRKAQEGPDLPKIEQIIPLPETTYSDMQVKNIVMELRKGNAQDGGDETVVTFEINNTTDQKVESQFFEAILIDANEEVVATMPHNYIRSLEVGASTRVNVVYKGDLTSTTHIKLIEE